MDPSRLIAIAKRLVGWLHHYGLSTSKREHEAFAVEFQRALERVRAIDFQAGEEPDPVRQAPLEVRCALALETPYNDFKAICR